MTIWRYLVLWRNSPQDNWQVAAEPPVQIQLQGREPLYQAIAALGAEGWELIAAVEQDHIVFKQSA